MSVQLRKLPPAVTVPSRGNTLGQPHVGVEQNTTSKVALIGFLGRNMPICKRTLTVCSTGISSGSTACYSRITYGDLVVDSKLRVYVIASISEFLGKGEYVLVKETPFQMFPFRYEKQAIDTKKTGDKALIPIGKYNTSNQLVALDEPYPDDDLHLHI